MADVESTRMKIGELENTVRKIGNYLSKDEVNRLLSKSRDSTKNLRNCKIRNGQDFILAMVKSAMLDETNYISLINHLKSIKRHDLIRHLTIKKDPEVSVDPVEEYFKKIADDRMFMHSERTCTIRSNKRKSPGSSLSNDTNDESVNSEPPVKCQRRSRRQRHLSRNSPEMNSVTLVERKQYTCDIRLRVKAEYCNYDQILEDSVNSNKADPIEKQLDCFNQSNALLHSRDLGCVVCDIKFSDLSYLDSFWKDYLNGSLANGLKGVFITDSLRQVVGNEDLKLLVHVEEKDYLEGRRLLLKNL
ncbi:death effector domain-containing protein-like isoform X1 [Centruroides vittatus]|uniref:death effector domain-containing protein-like isoform X1 n=1 Tax=Centruroides vittatus TaxID=120091 RepID=UPI003510453F